MADCPNQWTEHIGVARTEILDGLTATLEVWVPDFLPNYDGDIPLSNQCQQCTVKDPILETTKSGKVHHRKTVKCVYLGFTNHIVPCVHIGERVKVLCYAGTEAFYWMPLGRDPGLRLHEHMRWYAMSQPESVEGGWDEKTGRSYKNVQDDNSYWIDINTNKGQKSIWMHTSQKDGECHGYDFRILVDTCKGKCKVELYDSDGNILFLDTHEHRWQIWNIDNSYLDIYKENITMHCNDTMQFVADKHLIIRTPDYQRLADKQQIVGKTRDSDIAQRDYIKTTAWGVQASSAASIKTTKYSLNASAMAYMTTSDMSLTASKITYTGEHTFAGPSFIVGTAHGLCPVVILFGSNSW